MPSWGRCGEARWGIRVIEFARRVTEAVFIIGGSEEMVGNILAYVFIAQSRGFLLGDMVIGKLENPCQLHHTRIPGRRTSP